MWKDKKVICLAVFSVMAIILIILAQFLAYCIPLFLFDVGIISIICVLFAKDRLKKMVQDDKDDIFDYTQEQKKNKEHYLRQRKREIILRMVLYIICCVIFVWYGIAFFIK